MKLGTILIVDDTVANLDLLKAVLESHSYEVKTASSGPQALASIKESIPDLVVLDVMMPEMSGYEVCQAIRQDPLTKSLPVLMLSALDPALEKVKGLEAGADDFLGKPLNQAELFARIDSLLRIASIRKELEAKLVEQENEIINLNNLKLSLSTDASDIMLDENQVNTEESHRSEVTMVVIQLHRFSQFVTGRQTEEVAIILSEVHQVLGKLIGQFFGKVQRFSCDEFVILFNDPTPIDNPMLNAASFAKRFNTAFNNLKVRWNQKGYSEPLFLSIGIATGYATLKMTKIHDKEFYTVLGDVREFALKLCHGADSGEILIDARTASKLSAELAPQRQRAIFLDGNQKHVEAFKI